MPTTKPSTTRRTNRAFRIAYWADVQRIYYTSTLTAFFHTWALCVIRLMIPSAVTAIQFLAALHRSSRQGYIGCAVAYPLLAKQIAKATGRKCSVRTLQRGLTALKVLGLVELRPWTMPDQRIRIGDREVIVSGTGRAKLAPGEWRSLQIRIVTLTERAISLWDKLTKSQGDQHIPHFRTYAKLADRSHNDQCVNTHMVQTKSANDVAPNCPRQSVLDIEPSKERATLGSPSNEQGRSTRPSRSTESPGAPVGHRASTPQKQVDETQPPQASGGASSDPPSLGKSSTDPKPLGCSQERPKIPRGAPSKLTWSVARVYILSELHKTLEGFSRRQADTIYSRARFELSRNYPAGWPTSVDWAYWIGRFPKFTPTERRYHIMRDILPLLKSPAAITPAEPRRCRQGSSTRSTRSDAGAKLPEFLKKMYNRFCED